MAGLLGQLHALVDGGAGGDAVHVEQLECAQAQGDENFGVEFGVGAGEQGVKLVVELNLPAQHAQHQRRGQVAVGSARDVDGFAAQQIVGVGLAALDGHENLEGGFAGWRDWQASGTQPNRALAGERDSAQKLGCSEALFAFELDFEEFQPGVSGAG